MILRVYKGIMDEAESEQCQNLCKSKSRRVTGVLEAGGDHRKSKNTGVSIFKLLATKLFSWIP